MGVSASGCHTNMSLWTGGKDKVNKLSHKSIPAMDEVFTYVEGGKNTFMPDTKDVQLPGKVGLKAIGGVMKHLGALTAIGSSTVNSYRRLWDTGFWAPVYADWGYQNRTCGLRVSAPGRFEYRSVDSMHNPYLMGPLNKDYASSQLNDIQIFQVLILLIHKFYFDIPNQHKLVPKTLYPIIFYKSLR